MTAVSFANRLLACPVPARARARTHAHIPHRQRERETEREKDAQSPRARARARPGSMGHMGRICRRSAWTWPAIGSSRPPPAAVSDYDDALARTRHSGTLIGVPQEGRGVRPVDCARARAHDLRAHDVTTIAAMRSWRGGQWRPWSSSVIRREPLYSMGRSRSSWGGAESGRRRRPHTPCGRGHVARRDLAWAPPPRWHSRPPVRAPRWGAAAAAAGLCRSVCCAQRADGSVRQAARVPLQRLRVTC